MKKCYYLYRAQNKDGHEYADVTDFVAGRNLLAFLDSFREDLQIEGFELKKFVPYKSSEAAKKEADKWNDWFRQIGVYAAPYQH